MALCAPPPSPVWCSRVTLHFGDAVLAARLALELILQAVDIAFTGSLAARHNARPPARSLSAAH